MEIGKKLKEARLNRDLTQEVIAEKLNVSRQTISNWENEKSYPDIISVIELSTLYSISLDDLLKGDDAYDGHRHAGGRHGLHSGRRHGDGPEPSGSRCRPSPGRERPDGVRWQYDRISHGCHAGPPQNEPDGAERAGGHHHSQPVHSQDRQGPCRAAGHPEPPVRRAGLPARRPDGISAGPAGGMTAPAVAVSAASCYNKGNSAGLTGLK